MIVEVRKRKAAVSRYFLQPALRSSLGNSQRGLFLLAFRGRNTRRIEWSGCQENCRKEDIKTKVG